MPDFPKLLPSKIPKNGQADAQQGNLFILQGIMALKKPASFVPPVLCQSCFETGTSRDMTCFSGTGKPVSLSKKDKKKSYDHE